MTHWLVPLACFGLAFVGTAAVRGYAVAVGMLDLPSDRSSHSIPTPRGGGLAIVGAVLVGTFILMGMSLLPVSVVVVVTVGGGAIATVGFIDDRVGLLPSTRLVVHLGAAALAVFMLEGWRVSSNTDSFIAVSWLVGIVWVLGLVWMTNLFNFMDGIDGIAGAEAVFVAAAGAWLSASTGDTGVALLFLNVAACVAGFLVLNWAPAKVFMGDVGSGFLGYIVGLLALLVGAHSVFPFWTILILCSLFIGDATATLLRRTLAGESWTRPHRSHAYQRLAARMGSHAKVAVLYMGTNVLVILPLAWWSFERPVHAPVMALGVIMLAGTAALCAGAGKPE